MAAAAPPLETAVPWATRHLHTAVLHVRSLPGATLSDLYRLALGDGGSAVLRLFTGTAWLVVEPDLAEHEAAALLAVEPLAVPTPQLIAFDPDGGEAGAPAVLMTDLPGRVELLPRNLDAWLTALAAPLRDLAGCRVEEFPWTYRAWQNLERLEVPYWSERPAVWRSLIEAVGEPPPPSPVGLIHRDYHPTNVLWDRGRVSGVVDWVNACLGPIGIDTAHCRLNLAAMYGPDVADLFTHKAETATTVPHFPYWDLLCIAEWLPEPNAYEPWPEFGLEGIDSTLVRERVEEFAARAVGQPV